MSKHKVNDSAARMLQYAEATRESYWNTPRSPIPKYLIGDIVGLQSPVGANKRVVVVCVETKWDKDKLSRIEYVVRCLRSGEIEYGVPEDWLINI